MKPSCITNLKKNIYNRTSNIEPILVPNKLSKLTEKLATANCCIAEGGAANK